MNTYFYMPAVLAAVIGIVITVLAIWRISYCDPGQACLMIYATILIWVMTVMLFEEGPERKEVLEKGDRKEVTILYVTGNEEPAVHMEGDRSVKIDMDNVVISEDGKDRAFAYDLDSVLPWGQRLHTYSEYILYLTPETLQKAGINLPSDENQTEYDIPPETEK